MPESHQPSYDHYIKALMDISQAVTSDLFLEDVFKLIVMVVAKVTGVDICSLWLVDEHSTPPKIRLKATQSFEPEYVIDRSLNLDEGVVGVRVSPEKMPLGEQTTRPELCARDFPCGKHCKSG